MTATAFDTKRGRPQISVVLASCEGAAYIQEQIESILSQLAPSDELVVSDDSSTDDTVARIRALDDPRIRVLVNDGRAGYVRNFERAIYASRGDYLFFSDQDDIWLPGKVDASLRGLEQVQCVASDAEVVDSTLSTMHPSYFRLRGTRSFSSIAIFLRPSIIGATMACRRPFVASLLPFPSGVPHDFWLTLNASLRRELMIIQQPLILYRRHATVASLSATGRRRPLSSVAAERMRLLFALLRRRVARRCGEAISV